MSEYLEHVVGRVRDAHISTDPFPHMMIPSFLPSEEYEHLVRTFPSLDPAEHSGAFEGRTSLAICSPYADKYNLKDTYINDHWVDVGRVLASTEVVGALCDRFDTDPDRSSGPTICIHDDFPGSQVGIHKDRGKRTLTVMLYIPTQFKEECPGTTLYRHSGGDNWIPVVTPSFEANFACIIKRTEDSFHGTERPTVGHRTLLTSHYEV